MPVELSIVIVSYNVKELLRDCLTSVISQIKDQAVVEIIVVDNNSSDDSVEMMKKYFPNILLIPNKQNVGFSSANNQGMEIAQGKYVFLLNPDTVLKNNVLDKFFSFAKEHLNLFLLGPRLENVDGSLQVSAWKQPGVKNVIAESFFLHRALGVSEYEKEKFNTSFSPEMISGAALFFPRTLFEEIGGLDANLFWMEDADFSRRAKNAGAEINYLPEAIVTHFSGQSAGKNLRIAISNQLLSKLKYLKKYSGGFTMFLASIFCFLQIVSRIIIFLLLSPFEKKYRQRFSAYCYAFRKFFSYIFANDNRVT